MKRDRAPDPFPMFKRYGTPDDLNEFDDDVGLLQELFEILDHSNKQRSTKSGSLSAANARSIVYALVLHRSRRGKGLKEVHLCALAAALNFRGMTGAARRRLGMPPVLNEENYEKWYTAADLKAVNPKLSLKEIARELKIDPDTVEDWQKDQSFNRRVKFVQSIKHHGAENAPVSDFLIGREKLIRRKKGSRFQ